MPDYSLPNFLAPFESGNDNSSELMLQAINARRQNELAQQQNQRAWIEAQLRQQQEQRLQQAAGVQMDLHRQQIADQAERNAAVSKSQKDYESAIQDWESWNQTPATEEQKLQFFKEAYMKNIMPTMLRGATGAAAAERFFDRPLALEASKEKEAGRTAIEQAKLDQRQKEFQAKMAQVGPGKISIAETKAKEQLQHENQVRLTKGLPPLNPQEEAAFLQSAFNNFSTPTGVETTVEYTPGGGVAVTTKKGMGNIPISTLGTVETQISDNQRAIGELSSAQSKITSKNVGIPGVISDTLTRTLGQFVPALSDPKVAADRTSTASAIMSYINSSPHRGGFGSSKSDEMIREAIKDPNSIWQSADRMNAVIDSMKIMRKVDSIAKARSVGRALDEWMVRDLPFDEINTLVKEGTLPQNGDAVKLWKKVNNVTIGTATQ